MTIKSKKYCLDTSGLSNPLGSLPEDIYPTLWSQIRSEIEKSKFAVNKEIYDELLYLKGDIEACIKQNEKNLLLEIGQPDWDWKSYLTHVERMRVHHKSFISEYNGNRKNTVGLTDVSIVALAKTLSLPLVSMENLTFQKSQTKVRIPELCSLENVQHFTFNDLLRLEGIKA